MSATRVDPLAVLATADAMAGVAFAAELAAPDACSAASLAFGQVVVAAADPTRIEEAIALGQLQFRRFVHVIARAAPPATH